MARFDRYMLSQLLVVFGFFALVLVAIFWISRAVGLFDRLIGDGQSALVFLEFSALGLPKLIVTIIPIATFAASVYVTNRLNNESELTVMQATGSGPWRLARPVFVYGLVAAVMAALLTHVLVPTAQAQLFKRELEISRNVTAGLLTEGTFLTPTDGVTFYSRSIGDDGVLHDVFVSDRRPLQERITYTAAEAYLVQSDTGATLIMVDGLAQRLNATNNTLSTAKFRDFSFDISGLTPNDTEPSKAIRHIRTASLIADWQTTTQETGSDFGAIAEELHGRFAKPLFCLVAAMIGFSTLLISGFSRFGVWRETAVAFGLLLVIDGMRSGFSQMVLEQAKLWPVMYVPSLIGGVVVMAMLAYVANPAMMRRKRKAVAP